MGAIADLWKSERGLVAIVLIAAATFGLATSRITVDQWTEFTKWIFITYAAAKTITTSVGLASGGAAPANTSTASAPATPQLVKPAVTKVRGDADPAA